MAVNQSTSDERSILFFGDGSSETQTTLSRLLRTVRPGTLARVFLDQARDALKEEKRLLPPREQNWLPSLDSLDDFISPNSVTQPIPALHPVEIIITQIACFISSHEKRPSDPYPNASTHIVVGLCFGELSASAVCLASSLLELITVGVDAVRAAFRAGIIAQATAEDIETAPSPAESWSVALPRDTGVGEPGALHSLCEALGCTRRHEAYISAESRRTVTIGAPPSTIRKILDHFSGTPGTRSRVHIYGPYHANRLYSKEDVATLIKSPSPIGHAYDYVQPGQTTRNLISGFSGTYYDAQSGSDLLGQVLYSILAEPILWDNVVAGCGKVLSSTSQLSHVVRNFGPTTAAEGLSNALKKTIGVDIRYDGAFMKSAVEGSEPMRAPLAIVGMSGRFPDAADIHQFWTNLENGLDSHKVIPSDRFDPSTHLKEAPFGCFIDEPGLFDPRFFNMSPREALETDPGQRLALVTAYEALEMSGFVPNRTNSSRLSRIGTFFGQVADEYKEQNMAQDVGTYFIPGSMRAFGPGRLNYFFKFGGPAYNVDTACSSSLVALNLACHSIWSQDCDTAVAGGMNICCSSDNFRGLSTGHFLSKTGGCKTYDEHADGYCRGEAVGAVVIKRLDAALADNDKILGTILSTGTNYNFLADSITRPHAGCQEDLYRDLLKQANINASDIDYIEAHGTGTQAGDAVETSSIANVFAPLGPGRRPADRPLLLGAVKSNVGHGESASGVTALIKSLLVMENGRLPPHVGIKTQLNHRLPDLKEHRISIPAASTPLPKLAKDQKRRIMVNNFSAAGGNTALVLEAPPDTRSAKLDPRPTHVVSVTAKSSSALKNNVSALANYLESHPDTAIADVAYTTTARRIQYPFRATFSVSSSSALQKALATTSTSNAAAKPNPVAFAFTGQGSFNASMAAQLFQHSSQFRGDVLRFEKLSVGYGFPSLVAAISGSAGQTATFGPTQTQLALVALEMALVRLYASLGIQPQTVVGHSLGEYAALFAAGVLSASDVIYLVGSRAQLLEEQVKPGTHGMLAVNSAQNSLTSVLGSQLQDLEVACVNGPRDIVLSGEIEHLRACEATLKQHKIRCTLLDVPYAFHSSQIEPILDTFEQICSNVRFAKPSVPVLSPLLGREVTEEGVFGPSYLRRHAREAVNFEAAVQGRNSHIWLELGPHPICSGMLRETLGVSVTPTLRRSEDNWTTVAQSLATLHGLGLDVKWQTYHNDFEDSLNLVALPAYAFDNKNYWIPYKNDWLLYKQGAPVAVAPVESGPATTSVQRLISKEGTGNSKTLVFESDLHRKDFHSIIAGHVMNGCALCPASVYADIALTVADYIRQEYKLPGSHNGLDVTAMEIVKPIIVALERPSEPRLLRIHASADIEAKTVAVEYRISDNVTAMCSVSFADADAWMSKWSRGAYLVQKRIEDLAASSLNGTTHKIFKKLAYKLFGATVVYEERFQGMQEILFDSEALEASAVIKLHQSDADGKFFFSPFWVDAFVQLSGFVVNANETLDADSVYISHGWSSLRFGTAVDASKTYQVHVKMQPSKANFLSGDITVFQGDTMVGQIQDLEFQKIPRTLLDKILSPPSPAVGSTRVSKPAAKVSSPQKQINAPARVQAPAKAKRVVASGTAHSEQYKKLIAEEVGVSVEELQEGVLFTELGVDSLLSLTLSAKIRETFRVDLPQDAFQEHATVGSFGRFLARLAGEPEEDSTDDDSEGDSDSQTDPGSVTIDTPASEISTDSDQIDTVRSIVANQIGVEVAEVVETEDLTTLGVDSLMALSIFDAIRESIGVAINTNDVGSVLSMASIERALGLEAPAAPSKPVDSATSMEMSKATSEGASKNQAAARPSQIQPQQSFLLQGDPQTAKHTIFLFPDGSGAAASYAKLPLISSSACVYGLNSPFLKTPEQYSSVEEVSRILLQEVRKRQSRGPYIIAGWSAGGYYAFEAVRQLLASGQAVKKLILIDSPCRLQYEAMPLEVLKFLEDNKIMGDGSAAPAWMLDHFAASVTKITDYVPTPLTSSSLPLPETYVIWASDGVAEDFEPSAHGLDTSVRVTDFLLKKRPAGLGAHHWDRLLPGTSMWAASMPGNHFQIVMPPNGAILSQLMGDAVQDDEAGLAERWQKAA